MIFLFTYFGHVPKNTAGRKGHKKLARAHLNELWQIDIAGVQHIPGLGDVFLIATLADHSRVCKASIYYSNQCGVNIVLVIHDSIEKYARPTQIVSDNCTQFKNLIGDLGTRYYFFFISTASKDYITSPINPRMIQIPVVIWIMMSGDVKLNYQETDQTRVELTRWE